jgi:hypothetical protein
MFTSAHRPLEQDKPDCFLKQELLPQHSHMAAATNCCAAHELAAAHKCNAAKPVSSSGMHACNVASDVHTAQYKQALQATCTQLNTSKR